MAENKRVSTQSLTLIKKNGPNSQTVTPKESRRLSSGICSRDSQSTEYDRIKFNETSSIFEHFDTDYLKLASEFDRMDETLKLFHSMPRGLAYFISAGPPKQVHEYSDYVKVCKQYDRLVAELSLQEEPRMQRWRVLNEKKFKFLESMQNFDHFLKDNDRKRARAREQYFKRLTEKRNLIGMIPVLKTELGALKMERDKMHRQMVRLKPANTFMDAIIKSSEGQFRNVPDIMHRSSTLHLNYLKQMFRLVRSMEVLEKSRDLVDSMVRESNNYVLRLRGAIVEKSKERDDLTRANLDRERVVHQHEHHRISQMVEEVQIMNSIKNIVNQLTTFRPFTTKRLYEKEDVFSQIEAIGIIISDYGIILGRVQYDLKASEASKRRKKTKEAGKSRSRQEQERTRENSLVADDEPEDENDELPELNRSNK